MFFEELPISVSKAILKNENLLNMDSFKIDVKSKSLGYDKLDEFYLFYLILFNLTNLIKSETCFTKNHKSRIDFFLTNTPLPLQKTHMSETSKRLSQTNYNQSFKLQKLHEF